MPARPRIVEKTVAIDTKRAELRSGNRSEGGERKEGDLAPGAIDHQDQTLVKCRIMIVDADEAGRTQISGILADLNHELIETQSSAEAFQVLKGSDIDLIIVNLDVPDGGGLAFCEMIRKHEPTRLIPVFVKADASEQEMEIRAITAGADEFLVSPIKPSALRARVHATLRYKSIMESLDDAETVLFSLARSVEDRDPDLGQHCQRLALMAAGLGIALGLPAADIRTLHRGGYLHDIGKIGIADRVLFKAGPLNAGEWEIMKSHAARGERICAFSKSLASVLPIIRHHHEKFDGTGYPDGLAGEQIPLLARILQVADIYDALTTERPYKRAYEPDVALAILREETAKGWRDPFLVEVFADLLPVFRHPGLIDSSRLSLQLLAESLEQHRRVSMRAPITPPEKIASL